MSGVIAIRVDFNSEVSIAEQTPCPHVVPIMVHISARKTRRRVPRALKVGLGAKQIVALARDAALAWKTDGAASMGAAIAYYTNSRLRRC